jgi:hypothetical protein
MIRNEITKIYSDYLSDIKRYNEIENIRDIYRITQEAVENIWGKMPKNLKGINTKDLDYLVDITKKIKNRSVFYGLQIFDNKVKYDFKNNFNKVVDFLRRAGVVGLKKIYLKNILKAEDYKILRDSFVNGIVQKVEYVKANIEQKVSFIKDYLGIDFNKEDIDIKKIYKPKITLPQRIGVGEKDKKIIKVYERKYADFQKFFKKEGAKLIEGVINIKELNKKMFIKLEEFYPTGKVPYLYIDKYGRLNVKNVNLNWYSELWTNYIKQTSYSFSTIANAKLAGQDLVKVVNYYYGCSLCEVHIGQIYSISGKTPGYPILEWSPPYHPFCHCLIIIWII